MMYELLIMLIGWLYPAFATYSSLNGGLRSQIAWMKYWIVFGVFNAFHLITGCVEPWVPLLAVLKLFVLCWMLPSLGGGSQLIHDELLDPLLRRNKEAINVAVDSVCSMSGALLRELIKMIYQLLVDVVEQCWLMTRNVDDIHVTPRLQAAINEVIAELRAARQAAIFMPPLPQPAIAANAEPEPDPEPVSIAVAESTSEPDEQLRILFAEAASARRMQLGQQLCSREHLAPIVASQPTGRPAKPKRAKRKQHLDLELEADRAYCEFCAAEREQELMQEQMEQMLLH